MTDDGASRQLIEAGQHFDIWRLLSAPRHENEAMLRALCRSVYLGDNVAMCRVLGRYKMYVDTRDLSISSHLLLEGYWEMWVTEAMMRHVRPGMTVLDIGANLGYFTMLLADLVGHEGRVLAFEPNPEMASRTQRSISVNGFGGRATLHQVALADKDGEMLLDVVVDMPGGGHLVAMAPMTEPEAEPEPVAETPVPAASKPLDVIDYAPLPRAPREPLPPVALTLPEPPAPATGLFGKLAALVGYVPAAELARQRAALENAVAEANAALNETAQQRIEAAIVEAVAAAELSAGARVAAAQAAAAAEAAAAAASGIGAQAVAAIEAAAQGLDERLAAAVAGPAGQSLHRVPIRRLDAIPGAIDADFIKMDVEGAEQMVWSGMGGLLDRGRALTIFMEFTIERFSDPHGFLDEIERRGFSMAIIDYVDGVVPITREQLFARSHAIDNMLVFSRGDQEGAA